MTPGLVDSRNPAMSTLEGLSGDEAPVRNLGTAIRELFRPLGGVDSEIPPREPMRDLPRLD